MFSNVWNTMVQSTIMPDTDIIGFSIGIASISRLLAELRVLSVCVGFLIAVLKGVMMPVSLIGADCIIVFPTLGGIGFAVESRRCLDCWRGCRCFRFMLVF